MCFYTILHPADELKLHVKGSYYWITVQPTSCVGVFLFSFNDLMENKEHHTVLEVILAYLHNNTHVFTVIFIGNWVGCSDGAL